MIKAEGIRRRFGSHQVLKGVSFRVEDGQIVALMGAMFTLLGFALMIFAAVLQGGAS